MPRPRRTAGAFGLGPQRGRRLFPLSAGSGAAGADGGGTGAAAGSVGGPGLFLSFSVGCFARALGRGGVYLALAAFGPRCLFVLPCTLLLTVQGLSAAARRRDGQKVRLTEGAYWRRVGLCGLILLIGAALELTFGPRLLQWVIARTL